MNEKLLLTTDQMVAAIERRYYKTDSKQGTNGDPDTPGEFLTSDPNWISLKEILTTGVTSESELVAQDTDAVDDNAFAPIIDMEVKTTKKGNYRVTGTTPLGVSFNVKIPKTHFSKYERELIKDGMLANYQFYEHVKEILEKRASEVEAS